MVESNLGAVCGPYLCSRIENEFSAWKSERNLTGNHSHVFLGYCFWCTKRTPYQFVDSRMRECLEELVRRINESAAHDLRDLHGKGVQHENVTMGNYSLEHHDILFDYPWIPIIFICLYTFFITLGLVSNVLVVIVLIKKRTLANITNVFVLALSCSDILMCGLLMPLVTAYYISSQELIASYWFCKFILSSLHTPVYVSCLTILCIAIDRYLIIVYPLKPRMSHRMAVSLIIVTLSISITINVPVMIWSGVDNQNKCQENWPTKEHRLIYTLSSFCLQFFAPLMVSGCLYFRIYRKLEERIFKKRETERKRRTNKILMSIVISFVIFWSPWSMFNVFMEIEQFRLKRRSQIIAGYCQQKSQSWSDMDSALKQVLFGESDEGSFNFKNLTLIELCVRLFAIGSACLNPYLYGWFNEVIREGLKDCCFKKKRSRKKRRVQKENSLFPRRVDSDKNDSTYFPLTDSVRKGKTEDDLSLGKIANEMGDEMASYQSGDETQGNNIVECVSDKSNENPGTEVENHSNFLKGNQFACVVAVEARADAEVTALLNSPKSSPNLNDKNCSSKSIQSKSDEITADHADNHQSPKK